MVQINFANKEIQCKIVYDGPGMSGKTTNLEVVHQKAPPSAKGELTSIATEGDRTLFFDFMPLDLGSIAGIKTKFQLYTVPGQVYYNSTRKLVLQGVDGIVFVADSQKEKVEENIEAIGNLKTNLAEYGLDLSDLPFVLQWNKRDLPTALPLEVLEERLNEFNVPTFEAVAATGEGVFPTLKALASLVLESINREKSDASESSTRATVAAAAARTVGGAAPAAPSAPRAPSRPARASSSAPKAPAGRPRPAAQPTVAARPTPRTVAPARPRGAEPARRPAGAMTGKVKIRESGDSTRLAITMVVALVILAAIGFLVVNFL